MTAHVRGIPQIDLVHPAKYPLPAANLDEFARQVVIFTPSRVQLEAALLRARRDLPGLADVAIAHRVMAHNPDSVWGIARRDGTSHEPVLDGFAAFLMLNRKGARALLAGTFDASDPDPALLTQQNEKPAAIYVWCMWAPGGVVAGIPLAFEKIWTPLYREADLYARAVTPDGRRLLETMGFTPGATFEELKAADLHYLPRGSQQAQRPLYDRYSRHATAGAIAVTLARSMDDVMRVFAIRSAVYVAEQACPYDEEYDGNDFCAAHMLGYIGDEPAACIRIRYFADFAKIERLAVRKEFRTTRVSTHLIRAAIELCRAKGYKRLYGHARKGLVKFWNRFGFEVIEGGHELVFSDFDYVEMQFRAEADPAAITIGIDPYVINRPEGRWHRQGILERSAVRPVTRPSLNGAR